jgi:hypothetical protein
MRTTQDVDRNTHARDVPPTEGDKFARESNTWRRMRPWQIWTAAGAAAAFIVIGLIVL